MEIKVKLVGLSDVKKAIKELDRLPRIKAEIGASALEIQRLAKRDVPVRTGHARNTTIVEFVIGGAAAEIGTVAPYAPYIEFGTERMAARPYLMPAFEEVEPKFQKRLAGIYK